MRLGLSLCCLHGRFESPLWLKTWSSCALTSAHSEPLTEACQRTPQLATPISVHVHCTKSFRLAPLRPGGKAFPWQHASSCHRSRGQAKESPSGAPDVKPLCLRGDWKGLEGASQSSGFHIVPVETCSCEGLVPSWNIPIQILQNKMDKTLYQTIRKINTAYENGSNKFDQFWSNLSHPPFKKSYAAKSCAKVEQKKPTQIPWNFCMLHCHGWIENSIKGVINNAAWSASDMGDVCA